MVTLVMGGVQEGVSRGKNQGRRMGLLISFEYVGPEKLGWDSKTGLGVRGTDVLSPGSPQSC